MRWFACLVALLAGPAWAVECENIRYEGNRYTACTVDMSLENLALFLRDGEGTPYTNFRSIEAMLGQKDMRLTFGMNAGMFHSDFSPVGQYVENGVEEMRLLTNASPGNFGLLPNGVFCIGEGRADVVETLKFKASGAAAKCQNATQSGPMLVIDGELHPRFLPDGTSRYVRNGVGTSAKGDKAVFVISNNSVTFHEFGSFFRDYLKLPQALYFDGNVSRLYAPQLGRRDGGRRLGPIVGVVEPRN